MAGKDHVDNAVCYVHSLEDALGIVQDYELRTTTKFTIYKKSKEFGNTGTLVQNNRTSLPQNILKF